MEDLRLKNLQNGTKTTLSKRTENKIASGAGNATADQGERLSALHLS